MSTHFTTIAETTGEDLAGIYRGAFDESPATSFAGEGVALVFERPSLRTRASSSTAVHQLGGFATFFSDEEIGLDTRESAEDVARTLSQMYEICAARLRQHSMFARMAAATENRLRLINLLSDEAHPTQAIADVVTLAEHFTGGDVNALAGLRVAYVGDATNVARSLAVALVRLGADVVVGAPAAYQLRHGGPEDPRAIKGPGRLTLSDDAIEAVTGAQAVYTDAWVSMGFEEETARRRQDLAAFRVTEDLMSHADPGAVLLHCLPAHRGDEITDEVLDSSRSLVWRQVYHRRSAMRGVLRWMKEGS